MELMDQPSSWDSLRKQARKLEAQLDDQMHIYRKLVVTKSDDGGKENDLESEIEQHLKQLQQVNNHMQTWVSSGGSEIFSHTLTRHQEILQDLTQEFYRLKSSLRAKKEHASLLEGFREFDRARVDLEEGGDDQALLKEHASISQSTSQMDNVISQAQATLGTLLFQRSTFGGINSKLANVGSRLPTVWKFNLLLKYGLWEIHQSPLNYITFKSTYETFDYILQVNQVLTAIKRKKSMDTIILSLVASVCTFLMLIYWMSK